MANHRTLPDPVVGAVYERLTVLGDAGRSSNGSRLVSVRCSCLVEKTMDWRGILVGHCLSCGCRKREIASARMKRLQLRAKEHFVTHEMSYTKTYRTWVSMKTRCYNPKATQWPLYGGRGIAICERWRADFEAFLADMGERPEGTSIDRIDPNGNYEPGNCRWATASVQSANRRPRAPLPVCKRRRPLPQNVLDTFGGNAKFLRATRRTWHRLPSVFVSSPS